MEMLYFTSCYQRVFMMVKMLCKIHTIVVQHVYYTYNHGFTGTIVPSARHLGCSTLSLVSTEMGDQYQYQYPVSQVYHLRIRTNSSWPFFSG